MVLYRTMQEKQTTSSMGFSRVWKKNKQKPPKEIKYQTKYCNKHSKLDILSEKSQNEIKENVMKVNMITSQLKL